MNNTSNNNNTNNNSNKKEKRKNGDNSTTKTEKRLRRAITEGEAKHSINKGEEEEEEGRLKTIVDIPKEVLATILEYLFFQYESITAFVELGLVSKVWRQMIHFVST